MDLLKLGAGSPLLGKISQSPFYDYKAIEKDNPTPIRIEWGPLHKRSGVAYLDCLHPPCLWCQDLGTWRERGRLTICLLCLERERRGKYTFDIEFQENSMLLYVLITKRLDEGGGKIIMAADLSFCLHQCRELSGSPLSLCLFLLWIWTTDERTTITYLLWYSIRAISDLFLSCLGHWPWRTWLLCCAGVFSSPLQSLLLEGRMFQWGVTVFYTASCLFLLLQRWPASTRIPICTCTLIWGQIPMKCSLVALTALSLQATRLRMERALFFWGWAYFPFSQAFQRPGETTLKFVSEPVNSCCFQ